MPIVIESFTLNLFAISLLSALFMTGLVAAGNPDESTASLLAQADSLFRSNSYDDARVVYLQAMEKAKSQNDQSALAETYAMISRTYLTTDKKEEGRPWIEKAAAIASTDKPLGWSRYLGVKGRFEWKDNNLEQATATFKQMYDYCHEHKLFERAVDAAHMVAITGSPDQQIEWGLMGIREAETGNIIGWLGPLWNNLGATYEDQHRYQDALESYRKAREYHWRYGNEKNKLIADWAIGHTERLLGNLDTAAQWLRPVLAWCERIDDIEFTGLTQRELGEIELAKGNNQAALDYFQNATIKLKEAGMTDWDPDGYNVLLEKIMNLQASK
jgi:tetratricopeptide (TPR) repeat protein